MSQENVEIARRAYEAFNRGDLQTMVANLAPNFEYATTGAIPGMTGVYRGGAGILGFLEWIWSEFERPSMEVHELVDAGNKVMAAVTLRGRGKQSGVETSWDVWHVWTVEHGKVVHGQAFTSRAEAREAAGLSE
jgi:ketosteroid isomerase-like protein